MALLFLDPSKKTGWALCEPFSSRPRMRVGTWKLPPGTNAERAAALATSLIRLLKEQGDVERVGVEIPMSAPPRMVEQVRENPLGFQEKHMVVQGNITTQNLLWCLHGSIAGVVAGFRIPLHPVGMGEWRKHTLGNGRIGGQESKRLCKSLLASMGIHVANQDEAEAGGGMFWLNGHRDRFIREAEISARRAA